jgi:hypothetical protein
MKGTQLVDLPDDAYRAHWLAFHEQLDWSTHQDVTRVPITFVGPTALYRSNKGSFMDLLRPEVHCRPYVGHLRRAKRTGAWISDDKLFEAAHAPALDFTGGEQRALAGLGRRLRKYFIDRARTGPQRAALARRSLQLKR